MSLLDKESLSKLELALDADSDTSPDSEVETVAEESTPVEEPTTTEGTHEGSSSTEPDNQDESGHIIPYGRFKKVVDTRNTLRSENDTLKAQLQAMQDQYASLQQPAKGSVDHPVQASEPSWLDDYMDGGSSGQEQPNQLKQLESRIHTFEVAKAQTELKKELGNAMERYPHVNEQILLHAVVQDPSVDVMEVAERYNTFVATIEEGAIDRHSKASATKASAPPRVKGVSSDGHLPGSSGDRQKPKTMREAKQAALSFLKDMEF